MKLAIVKNKINGENRSIAYLYSGEDAGSLTMCETLPIKGSGHIAAYRAAKLIEERHGLEAEYVKPDSNDFDEAVLILN